MDALHHLARRDCVSNCVVPSCSSIKCSSSEVCILSSQTCSACPSVTCVSFSITGSRSASAPIPKGAIAGIVLAVIALLLGLTFLGLKLRKRRQIIRDISEKASLRYSMQDAIYESEYVGPSEPMARFPSNASIQIGLGTSVASDVAQSNRAMSPLPSPDDHFFSADELLRMSYAESEASRTNSVSAENSGKDDAAIIQANKPVLAVRARAAVLQLTKRQSMLSNINVGTTNVGVSEAKRQSVAARDAKHRSLDVERMSSTEALQSFWEEESVTSSPVERELISPSRFAAMNSTTPTRASNATFRLSEQQRSPTKSRTSASVLSEASPQKVPDSERAKSQIPTQLFPAAHAPQDQPRLSVTDKFDWIDPSVFESI